MIPREIIYNDLQKKMNDKRIMVFSYFASKRALDDTVGFSNNHLIKWCGYTLDRHEGKGNSQIIEAIQDYNINGYFILDSDNKVNSGNTFISAKLNTDKFDAISNFAMIYLHEIQKLIAASKKCRIPAPRLLLVLSYIRVNLLRRQEDYKGKPADKPEFCFKLIKNISEDIGLTTRNISSAIKALEELDLIVTTTLPRYKDENGNWHTETTFFVDKYRYRNHRIDNTYDYKQELQWGMDYYKNKKFLTKKFDQNIEW